MMNAHYRLKNVSKLLVIAALVITACTPTRSTVKKAKDAEASRNFEEAMKQYKLALDQDPGDIELRLKYEQTRYATAYEHFQNGRRALEASDLETARTEFAKTLELDPSHALAEQELARVTSILTSRNQKQPETGRDFEQMKEAARTDPSQWLQGQLQPTVSGPISLRMVQDSRVAYETLANLAGINVIFDQDFRPSRTQLELNNVSIFEALDTLSLQTRNFWKPINKNTILVAQDNQTSRRNYEDLVFKTVYMTNSVTTTEITEAITALRTLLNMSFIAQSTSMNAILLRDTPDKIAIAEQIIEDIDKSKPEVIIEAMVLEVDRNVLRDLGILPPTSTTLSFLTPGVTAPGTTAPATTPPAGTTTTPATNAVNLRRIPEINSGNFTLTIPDTTAQFLATSAKTKLLQNPRVRATDNKQASIRIGSRVPVAQGSFQPAFAGATGTPVVQFQYVDIGVNLDILPRVLLNRDISVTTTVQVSALAGDRNLGGLTLPVFTNRSVTHEIRLAEGESNVLGGIITDTEAVSMAGIPGLKDIPILKYFFGQERKQRDETEIIIMLTPHIVRMPNIKDINLRGLNVGSVNQPKLRVDNSMPSAPATTPAAPTTPATPPPGAGAATQPPAAPTAPPPPPTPTNTTIAFAPSPVTLVAGPPVNGANTVNIVANGSVFAADLVLSYDPASFSIAQIRDGGLLSRDGQPVAVIQNIESSTGTVRISLERQPGAAPVSGPGNLVTLVLEPGARKGPATLKVTDFQVRDARQTVQAGRGTEVQVNVP